MVYPGQLFEGYLVESLLGGGGEAAVYRARAYRAPDIDDDAAVALKVLNEDHRGRANIARLAREFRAIHQLEHPHIVKVHRHGEYWMTMQYIDGGNMLGLGSLDTRLEALTQIAAALDYTHRSGIVHTDVKPTNILVHQDFSRGGAVLIDFGAVHLLAEDVWHRPGEVLASLPYAAPELLQGRLPQAATDEYARACTALEVLTGLTPFPADNPTALFEAHLHLPPPAVSARVPWLSRAFDVVFARAIAKDPDRRYESCTELIRHIAAVIKH